MLAVLVPCLVTILTCFFKDSGRLVCGIGGSEPRNIGITRDDDGNR